jgi:hypothetical protein
LRKQIINYPLMVSIDYKGFRVVLSLSLQAIIVIVIHTLCSFLVRLL